MQALIDSDKEVWLSVQGYEGCYLVSNKGQIYSEARTEFVKSKRTGGHLRYRNSGLLTPRLSNTGYLQIGLFLDGICKRQSVHRIVAKAFVPNPLGLLEVNHKDGNRLNNCADNLEWVSRKGNALHSTQILCKNRGVENTNSKLTEQDVHSIVTLLDAGYTQIEIAKNFNVTNSAIYRIQHGFNWAWLTGYDRKVG